MALTPKIDEIVKDKWTSIDWFGENIIEVDGRKKPWDDAAKRVDAVLLDQIGSVNSGLTTVSEKYDARITVGCRTDLFWRVTGFTTASGEDPATYDLECLRISNVGYTTSTSPSAGFGTVVAVLQPGGSITSYTDPQVKLGFVTDYYHAVKYFNEPVTADIGETTVGSFIGTVSTGSTDLTVMAPVESFPTFKEGQLVICDETGVLSGTRNTIVGVGTTIADLSGISTAGIGSTVTPIITLNLPTVGFASLPPAGPLTGFVVLDDPAGITTYGDYGIEFGSDPFSPQTIGIMSAGTLGIGTQIYYNNTGVTSITRTWNPEMSTEGIDMTDMEEYQYLEPNVGSGTTYYTEGFTNYPTTTSGGSTAATVGTAIGGIEDITDMYNSLSSCAAEDAALSQAISDLNSAESAFNSDISAFNQSLAATNALRLERNKFEQRIWGARQAIQAELDEVDEYEALQNHVNQYPDVIGP